MNVPIFLVSALFSREVEKKKKTRLCKCSLDDDMMPC